MDRGDRGVALLEQAARGDGWERLLRRGLSALSAYLVTSLTLLAAAIALKHSVSPALAQSALSVLFISAVVGGLEPGTGRAAAIGDDRTDARGIFWASAIKALIAAPLIGVVWRVSDPAVSAGVLLWLPAIVVSGFLAADFRVLLDVRGRHASAIWLKQGPASLAIASLAAMVIAGVPLTAAVAASTVLRLVATLAFVAWRIGAAMGVDAGAVLARLRNGAWPHFALLSVLAASSGSLDRFVALRTLGEGAYNGYFILFEVLSKFWLLSYLAAPIVFARRATGAMSAGALRRVHLAIWGAGAAYLAAIAVAARTWPAGLGGLVDAARLDPWALSAFGLAMVISSSAQLIMVDIQARGGRWTATGFTVVSLLAAIAVFYGFSQAWGVEGLLWAWLVKSALEMVFGGLALRMTAAPARRA